MPHAERTNISMPRLFFSTFFLHVSYEACSAQRWRISTAGTAAGGATHRSRRHVPMQACIDARR